MTIPDPVFIRIAAANVAPDESMDVGIESQTELDSHANMPVVGRNAYVLSDLGQKVDVSPFTTDYKSMQISVVDAAVLYDCPFTGNLIVFVIRNALYVPAMVNNLIPPFIMREQGIEVNETPKIQAQDPKESDHSLRFHETNLRVPLSLWGIFSYFPSRKPTVDELTSIEDIYLLTPSRFNPHDSAYAINESYMTDWQGELTETKYRKRVLLSEVSDDLDVSALLSISATEACYIHRSMEKQENEMDTSLPEGLELVPGAANEICSVLSAISPTLDDVGMLSSMMARATLGSMQMSLGSTDAPNSEYLDEGDDNSTVTAASSTEDDMSDLEVRNESLLDTIFTKSQTGQLDLDEIMASATHVRKSKSISSEQLSKVWRIDVETAKRTLDVTSQLNTITDDPKLSRYYGTNDRMLRYKWINDYFYMDTFFATLKGGKSSRHNTCCQLFVTEKGFVYVVPMRSKSEVLQAVKQFAKEIGAPEAIVCNASKEQTEKLDLKRFLHEIGTTLRVLEEGTPWANKAELYIGLIKEAVRKDMRDSNCPLAFWDYCVERRARINNMTAKSNFKLHGSTPHTELTCDEGNISHICQYAWYEWCYFREQSAQFPFNKELLGRILGPERGDGNKMIQWILKADGNVVPRRTSRPLNTAELNSKSEKWKRQIFDELIEARWGTAISAPPKPSKVEGEGDDFVAYEDDDETPRLIPDIEEPVDSNGEYIDQQPQYDKLINLEVQMQQGTYLRVSKVARRALVPNGKTTGTYHEKPWMNTLIYDVEFPDGEVKEYDANTTAENILSTVDDEGYTVTEFD